jgi:hypothetical protein
MVDSSTILVAGGYNGTNVLKSMQTYTVDSASVPGSVTSASTAQNLANVRVHFPLLWTGLTNKYLVFGGSSAVASGGDTASGSIELIDLGAGSWASSFGTLRAQRQAAAAVNLGVSGASNLVFLVAGGGASGTGGVELVIGP